MFVNKFSIHKVRVETSEPYYTMIIHTLPTSVHVVMGLKVKKSMAWPCESIMFAHSTLIKQLIMEEHSTLINCESFITMKQLFPQYILSRTQWINLIHLLQAGHTHPKILSAYIHPSNKVYRDLKYIYIYALHILHLHRILPCNTKFGFLTSLDSNGLFSSLSTCLHFLIVCQTFHTFLGWEVREEYWCRYLLTIMSFSAL